MTIVRQHLAGECLQHALVRQVAHKIIVGQQVNDADMGACLSERIGDGFADASGAARYHRHFAGKHTNSLLR